MRVEKCQKLKFLERSVKWPLKSSHVCACWLEIEDEANLLWDHNFLTDKEAVHHHWITLQ